MRRIVLALSATLFLTQYSYAGEVRSIITDSVQLTVEGPAVQTNRIGGTYSVNGSNISVTGMGGSVSGAGTYGVDTSGEAFSFSESYNAADTISATQTTLDANGMVDGPKLYGSSTTQIGGTAGTLAGTLSSTGGPAEVTAGGAGTTAIGQRVVELSVFQ